MKIRTLMSIAAVAALAASSVGITASGEAGLYLIGDINGDGIVDSADACSALAAYACTSSGKESPLFTYQESAADLNGDRQVDAVDASLILSYYAWVSVSDETAIMTDFLEKNGFKQKNEEEKLVRQDNFVLFDSENFIYDFTPQAESLIRSLADPAYTGLPAFDRRGINRLADEGPDAGCYDYVAPAEEEVEQ